MVSKDSDNVANSSNGSSGGFVDVLTYVIINIVELRVRSTYIVFIGVDSFSIKPFFTILLNSMNMFADPNITIQAKNKVYAAW